MGIKSIISIVDPARELQFPDWVFVFFACIFSRLLTSIRYIEDPDSLRFALAVIDYDVANLQPHFPAYPVFCFVVKIFFFFTGNFSVAFAITGGLATFGCIYFTVKLSSVIFKETPELLLAGLLFLNPLIWLMGNRFMPDLSGLAVVMAGLYFFAKWMSVRDMVLQGLPKETLHPYRPIILFAIIIGLLAGIRLSYLPLLMIPWLYIFITQPVRQKILLTGVSVFSVLLWMFPLLMDTGWHPLVEAAQNQASGHFEDFGGTVNSESDPGLRMLTFTRHLWADGLGGFWAGRHWITIIFGAGILSFLAIGIFKKGKLRHKDLFRIILASFVLYAIWILFYQNIIFKSRHHLPLIPLLLIVVASGYAFFEQSWRKTKTIALLLMLSANCWLTGKLVTQHRSPTAIAQLKTYMEDNFTEDKALIVSDLVKYYLTKQKVKLEFIDINAENNELGNQLDQGKEIYIVANLKVYHNFPLKQEKIFYHNPYVNRMWPVVILSKLQPKSE